MTSTSRIPRGIGWTAGLGLLGLAVTVPFSAPDGTGMQWDELVLFAVATGSAATIRRHSRRMDAAAARPWRVLVLGAVLFAVAQLLAGSFPGPAFDGLAADDVRDDLERGLRSLASISRTAQEHGLLLVVDGVASPGTAAEVRAAGAGLVQGEAAPCDLTSSDVSLLLRGREPAATH